MKIGWYVKRLKAMDKDEVLWRLEQKKLNISEKKIFGKDKIAVTDGLFYAEAQDVNINPGRIPVNLQAVADIVLENLEKPAGKLLGGYSYEDFSRDFHGGFQTDNKWPLIYSGDLQYRQRDDIGDARLNWELNRHFQFPALALKYAVSLKDEYLIELSDIFTSWNKENPFLWGISWTSVMEVAIRDINWMYTLAILERAERRLSERDNKEQLSMVLLLEESLSCGILNMTAYISGHFSRFSSANNHTIVEAVAIGMAGFMGSFEPWEELCRILLKEEIQRQTHDDGVNKEQSLHYQSFLMEAIGLLGLCMVSRGRNIPMLWRNYLVRMSRYLRDCCGNYGETIVFGDDDEGKILDLAPFYEKDHYRYVLQLMSLILPERYVDTISDVTLMCITLGKVVTTMSNHPLYVPKEQGISYPDGGVTILRSPDGRILSALDHGPLGFGSIAAHGHADALSFLLFREGKALFADPGTYIYHTEIGYRNLFRRTQMHNTLCLCGKDQSQMEGAFLWGRRAQTGVLSQDPLSIEAEHDGYFPIIHRRRLSFDGIDGFILRDRLVNVKNHEKSLDFTISFLLGKDFSVKIKNDIIVITEADVAVARLKAEGDCIENILIERAPISVKYGILEETKKLVISCRAHTDTEVITKIKVL